MESFNCYSCSQTVNETNENNKLFFSYEQSPLSQVLNNIFLQRQWCREHQNVFRFNLSFFNNKESSCTKTRINYYDYFPFIQCEYFFYWNHTIIQINMMKSILRSTIQVCKSFSQCKWRLLRNHWHRKVFMACKCVRITHVCAFKREKKICMI